MRTGKTVSLLPPTHLRSDLGPKSTSGPARVAAAKRAMTQQLCKGLLPSPIPLPLMAQPPQSAFLHPGPCKSAYRPIKGPAREENLGGREYTGPYQKGKGQPESTLAYFLAFRKITALRSLPVLPSPT